jgi:DNA-binding NtrC family response regulator
MEMTPLNLIPKPEHAETKPLYVVLAGSDIKSEELLISLLRQKGLVPIPSSSMKEALFLLAHRETALVICHASPRDGTFRELLSSLGSGSKVPVIVCADFYDSRLYLEAMELGAFDYFTYPYYRDGVEWVVGNALRHASKHAGGPREVE